MSISRGRRSFTGLPVWLAASAAAPATHEALLSLPPKPPPSRRTTAVTRLKSQPSRRAQICWTSVGCWVEECTTMSPSSPGSAKAIWPFEIEMLLPADAELGAQRVRRRLHRRVGIAAQQRLTAPAHRPWPPAPSRCRGWRARHRSRSSRARRRGAPRRGSSPRPSPAAGRHTRRGRRRTAARRCRPRRRRSCRECRWGRARRRRPAPRGTSSFLSRPCATGLSTSAACRVPAGSGMSSI